MEVVGWVEFYKLLNKFPSTAGPRNFFLIIINEIPYSYLQETGGSRSSLNSRGDYVYPSSPGCIFLHRIQAPFVFTFCAYVAPCNLIHRPPVCFVLIPPLLLIPRSGLVLTLGAAFPVICDLPLSVTLDQLQHHLGDREMQTLSLH